MVTTSLSYALIIVATRFPVKRWSGQNSVSGSSHIWSKSKWGEAPSLAIMERKINSESSDEDKEKEACGRISCYC